MIGSNQIVHYHNHVSVPRPHYPRNASQDRKDGRAKRFERRYFLEAQGYDFGKVVERVAQLLDMVPKDVLRSGKQARTVMARSLVCFWANGELGMTTVEISNPLKIGQSAVSRSSLRGEKITTKNKFSLL